MRASALLLVVFVTSAVSYRIGGGDGMKSFRAALELLRQTYPGLNLPYVPAKKTGKIFRYRRDPERSPLWDYRLRMAPNFLNVF
uniref:COesterase domain-containing protein n=1 Tax=Steinernema glaseri TaxID=37863 RepID=A0A1I7YL02_9BILA